jgi:DNA-binding protein H-NS
MLDNLKSLFATNSMTCLTAVLKAVADLVGFLEQQMQNDPAKVNDAIEQIKAVLDSHKK